MWGRPLEGPAQEVGYLNRHVEERLLPGRPVVDARGGEQVSEVVHLEVQPILERFRRLAVAGLDEDRRVQVAVRPLGLRDHGDGCVHPLVECRVAG